MSDCMSNICGMDGNYCSSCAKDRRIEQLERALENTKHNIKHGTPIIVCDGYCFLHECVCTEKKDLEHKS